MSHSGLAARFYEKKFVLVPRTEDDSDDVYLQIQAKIDDNGSCPETAQIEPMTNCSIKIPKLLIEPQLTKIKELLCRKQKKPSSISKNASELYPKDISAEVKKAFPCMKFNPESEE